jgi:hypothetical protein
LGIVGVEWVESRLHAEWKPERLGPTPLDINNGQLRTSFRAGLTRIAFLFLIVLFAGPAVAADLCPLLDPPKRGGIYDRRMTEATFSQKNLWNALRYLEEDLPQALAENAMTEDVRRKESYAIGYPNSLKFIKGYVLRNEALRRLAERDLLAERYQRGRVKQADVAVANARF